MGSPKLRILFVYKDFSQFVRKDFEILDAFCTVRELRSPFRKSFLSFFRVGFKQLIVLIRWIGSTDAVYCWFADYHSFLPAVFCRITGKRFFLVLGGYDVTHIPELNYGSFNKRIRGFCARYSIRRATLNLPVARALEKEARGRAGEIRVRVLPTGYDPALYLPSEDKESLILTVSITDSWQRFMVKGIDRFVELARRMPELRFAIVGMEDQMQPLIGEKPENLEILPALEHSMLLEWYGKARFYAQFSRSEGLPNAVCEAMLRNCVPIGVAAGGIPEAIGDAGVILEQWDPGAMAEKIRSLENVKMLSGKAREHIISEFQQAKRETALREIMKHDRPAR